VRTIAELRFDGRGFQTAAMATDAAARDLMRRQEALVHEEANILLDWLRRNAPRKTGALANSLYVSTSRGLLDAMGMPMAMISVRADQRQKLRWIVEGTKPHIIPKGGAAAQLAKGYPLSFFWPKGPKGPGWYHFWQVHHPGTRPNDFVGDSYKWWLPGAIRRFEQLGLVWSATYSNAGTTGIR
jgi:hypothetical protein